MSERSSISRCASKVAVIAVTAFMIIAALPCAAFATSARTEVPGKVYESDKDGHYEFSDKAESAETSSENTYGSFLISGEVSNVTEKSGVPAYEVSEGNLQLFYNYGDTLLVNENKDSWHLIEDKSKKLNNVKLKDDIKKGALILQTSTDGLNWIDEICLTDAFNEIPVRTESLYTTKDVQLINGCYYRLIVAYELRIRTEGSKVLFVNMDKFDYKKCVEVYEFYAYTDTAEANTSTETFNLGSKVRVADFDSYSGEKAITKDDPHYGWDLGKFFVSGYTDEVKYDGNMVFLKNVGDKVTLWFHLEQNIDKLNGNEKLSITADKKGSDQYFETQTMNFGRGTLIIRKTDYNNVTSEPTIYTNYLEANTSVGADTKVELFEEGDYEVALDYEITDDQLIDKVSHYRIFFKFYIRNGNCMVYPFDVVTGSELANSSMTENGFRLDLAKSRYLKINLKREMLTESADGLVEDTRFNGPARDGAEYTDEGIYTITVTNEYTGQLTVKKIYVGTNNILRAYMATGLSIPEINDLVEQGATISDDGTIQLVSVVQTTEDAADENESTEPESESSAAMEDVTETTDGTKQDSSMAWVGVVVVCAIVFVAIMKKSRNKKKIANQDEEGGMDE